MLVRPLRDEDFGYINAFFTHFPKAAFLNPVFLKGKSKRRDYRITEMHPDFPVYTGHIHQRKEFRGISYADAMIADMDRLRRANWRFKGG